MAGLAIDVIHFISCDVKKIVLFWYKFIKMIRASKGAMSEKTLQGGDHPKGIQQSDVEYIQ